MSKLHLCWLKYLKESIEMEWKACCRHQILYVKILHTWPRLQEKHLTSIHRLNMKLYLQILFGLLCTAVLIGWDPATPHPPAFGLIIYEDAIGAAKIDDISFWPPASISPFERRPFVILSMIVLFVEFCYLVNLHETGLAGPPMHAAIIALGGLGNN